MNNVFQDLVILVIFFSFQYGIAQNYQTVEEVNDACATLGFTTNEDALIAVDNIMEIIGLQKNFTIQECPNINNAVAKNITDKSGNIKRYILYDNEFFNKMDIKAGSDWAAISILAHEIGHHLNGHSLNNEGSNHEFELDADYFSGLILSKMGATLEEALSAINTFRYEKATSTHPAKQDRLDEIEKGWTIGYNFLNRNNNNIIKKEKKTNRETENETIYPDNMEPLVQELYVEAKKGNAESQNSLGYAYKKGNGVEKDFYKAIKWYRISAEKGNTLAQSNLGYAYHYGEGVEKDYNQAIKWFRKSAEQGNASAQYRLGFYYRNGEGVEEDLYEAVKWYRKSAEQGNSGGQTLLGLMYKSGNGVNADRKKAIYWFKKAANQGEEAAQYQLTELGETW